MELCKSVILAPKSRSKWQFKVAWQAVCTKGKSARALAPEKPRTYFFKGIRVVSPMNSAMSCYLINSIRKIFPITEGGARIHDGLAVFFGPGPYPAKRSTQALA